jgi:hypothetical protein
VEVDTGVKAGFVRHILNVFSNNFSFVNDRWPRRVSALRGGPTMVAP